MTFQKFRREESRRERELRQMPHPVWRGIGFLLLLVIPIFSFSLADLLVNEYFVENFLPYFPSALQIPIELTQGWVIDNFYGVLVVTLILTLIISFTMLMVTSIIYRTSMGLDYNQFDAPRPKAKKKKKRKLYKSKF